MLRTFTGIVYTILIGAICLLPAQSPVGTRIMQGEANDKLRLPADQIYLASLDIEKVPHELRKGIRYLDLGNIPLEARQKFIQVLNGHFNSLSHSALPAPLFVVPELNGSLVRLNIDDYEIARETYELLASTDYVFHVTVDKVVTTTEKTFEKQTRQVYDQTYRVYRQETYEVPKLVKREVRKKVQEPAPWVVFERRYKIAYDTLVHETGSEVPILRADVVFNDTAISAERHVGYYKLLGVNSRQEWERLIGFDEAVAKRGLVVRSAVGVSQVTLHSRAYVEKDAAHGTYRLSVDFRNPTGNHNALAVFGQPIEDAGEAFEAIGFLPNRMLTFALFNDKGVLFDVAPDFIAAAGNVPGNDHRVHVNMSCLNCHTDGGVKAYTCWVRNLMQDKEVLSSPDFTLLRQTAKEYTMPLEIKWDRDKMIFGDTVKKITGLEVKDYCTEYARIFWDYELDQKGLRDAELDTGIPSEKIKQVLSDAIRLQRGDPVLSVLTFESPRINTIPIRQYEERYSLLQALLLGGG